LAQALLAPVAPLSAPVLIASVRIRLPAAPLPATMIYIFSGIKNICSLPGMACRLCGDACKAINCNWAKECCNFVGKGCTHFMERPLSTYVLISVCLSLFQIYCCVDYMGTGKKSCKFGDDAAFSFTVWNLMMMGFAIVNLLFAPYFQAQVWKTIMENQELFVDGDAAPAAPPGKAAVAPNPGKWIVPRELVQEAFKRTFMEDFGVLVYFFLLLGALGLCVQGNTWMESSKFCSLKEEGWIPFVGEFFFGVAVVYTLLWYCCPCCSKSISIEKDIPEGYEMPNNYT